MWTRIQGIIRIRNRRVGKKPGFSEIKTNPHGGFGFYAGFRFFWGVYLVAVVPGELGARGDVHAGEEGNPVESEDIFKRFK